MAFWDKKREPEHVPNGLPGPGMANEMTPEMVAMTMGVGDAPSFGATPSGLRAISTDKGVIGEKDIKEAQGILQGYKNGKSNLESRIVEDELWWELRHWEVLKGKNDGSQAPQPTPQPSSAWLFNAILNKHADAMDNYPEPVVLPRERSDQASAEVLSSVLPVILEQNQFEQTYSDNWWEKLKHGTCAYGVFWNSQKDNGLGDVDIKMLDLLKIFWEPGVTDIQASRNLFILDMVDTDILDQKYPEFAGKMGGGTEEIKQYAYDDTVDVSKKSVVVDWYYKRPRPGGGNVLHYAKFVGNCLLFASENDPSYSNGWYAHGQYPVVLDVMFPEKGTPTGFGYVAICKDPQMYIDKISANILEASFVGTKKRYFIADSAGVNEEEFLDVNNTIVHVAGSIDDVKIKEITPNPVYGVFVDVVNQKVEEMKDTAGNRDVNSGATGSGVTAASAIAALQEAGSKTSRDMISTSYRAQVLISSLVIELMRQFYDEARSFRITGQTPGAVEFVDVSNQAIGDQVVGQDSQGIDIYRKPIFDLKVQAQRKNPFSRAEQNERAKELYGMGFFSPDRATEALVALEMMDFEGIEDVKASVAKNNTMMQMMQQMSQQLAMLTGVGAGQTLSADRVASSPVGAKSAVAKAQQPGTESVQANLGRRMGAGQ